MSDIQTPRGKKLVEGEVESAPDDPQPEALDGSDVPVILYQTLIESPDVRSGLRGAIEVICRFAGWPLGLAWLPTTRKNDLRLSAAWHLAEPALAEFVGACHGYSLPHNVGVLGRVWTLRTPEWTEDLVDEFAEPFSWMSWTARAGLGAALAVPLLHNDATIGILLFFMRQGTNDDPTLVQVIQRAVNRLGTVLRFKQTEEELRKRLGESVSSPQKESFEFKQSQEIIPPRERQQAAVAHIGQRALAGVEVPLLLQETCELVAATLNVEFCKVLELQRDGEALRLCAGVGWREGLVGRATVAAGKISQAGYTLAVNQPVIVEDLGTEKRFTGPPLLLEHGVISGMSVIIRGVERPFGVLGAHTATRRVFQQEDINFMSSVAHVLSEAIERKRSELALQRSESWLRSLVATTQDAVVSIDRRGCIVLFNAGAERIFGYAAAEIVGCKVNDLMAEPYASEHDGYIARYEKTGEAHAIGRIRTVTGRRKNGELFPIELSVAEVEVDDQVHYAAFLRDISETVELHTRAVESERLAAIGSTAARIGHEIANPLNGIYLTMQLVEQRLARQPSTDDRVATDIVRVKREIARLNQLVQEFRALSRQQTYNFRPTPLHELIDDVVELQEPLFEARGITVQRLAAAGDPSVSLDQDKIKQALLNLVKNAAEAMPHGGTLAIAVTAGEGEVLIEITDTGQGIPPDTDVFAPFFTTKKEGTGLGLIIVRQIIAAHGGSITYDSQPGKGTKFRITLPLERI